MIRIEPTALYSRTDLMEMLKPLGIDVDGWLAKTRPARRFRLAFWGGDLIAAIEKTPPLPARIDDGPAELPAPQNRGGRRRRKLSTDPLAPLKRLMRDE